MHTTSAHSQSPKSPDPVAELKTLRDQNETLRQLIEVYEGQTLEQFELIASQQRDLEERSKQVAESNEALGRTNAIQSLILDNSSLGIALVNQRQFDWANARLAEMTGLPLEELQHSPTRIIYPSDEVYEGLGRRVYAILAQGRRADTTAQLRRSEGQTFWCRIIGKALDPSNADGGSVWVFEDITERKQAERELRSIEVQLHQAQKLESVGRLAAGVAHEINTPIQFVSDSVHFLREASQDLATLIAAYRSIMQAAAAGPAGPELAERFSLAEEEADLEYLLENIPKAIDRSLEGLNRVTTIVRSMKEFAHPDQKEMMAVNLNQAVQSTLTVARNEYKYVADTQTEFGDLPPVVCHIGEVNQAVLNIVVNAAHAIEDVVKGTGARGRIVIKTSREGNSALITISDTGGGLPASIRDKVFDPFFSTKEVGRGTGQGLAIARTVIADKHGGELRFESEMGKGTTFFIKLPIEGKSHKAVEAAS